MNIKKLSNLPIHKIQNGLFLFSILLVSALFYFIVVTDQNMIWKEVYTQIVSNIVNSDRYEYSSKLPPLIFFVTDIFIFVILLFCGYGFYRHILHAYKNKIDGILISTFLVVTTIGVSKHK
jgi:hypothetical protein